MGGPTVGFESPVVQFISDFGSSIAGIVNAFIGIAGLILGGLVIYTALRLMKFLTKNVSVTVTYQNSAARHKP